MPHPAKKRRRERHLLRVIKGGLAPADGYTASRFREKGYRIGDLLLADLTKPRRPWYHRYAHKIGTLCVKNIDGYEHLNAHDALKKLQTLAQVGCEIMLVLDPEHGPREALVPKSLDFASMDQGEFEETVRGLCRFIAAEYWPSQTPEQVAEMAETMPDEV